MIWVYRIIWVCSMVSATLWGGIWAITGDVSSIVGFGLTAAMALASAAAISQLEEEDPDA